MTRVTFFPDQFILPEPPSLKLEKKVWRTKVRPGFQSVTEDEPHTFIPDSLEMQLVWCYKQGGMWESGGGNISHVG